MARRLLPTLVVLALGLLALAWGLWSLQRLFARETEEARQQLVAHRTELERYAAAALQKRLSEKLLEARPVLHRAVEDALAPADGLYLLFRGHQYLPRVSRPRATAQAPARRLFHQLEAQLGAAPSADAALERRLVDRLRLLGLAEAALEGDRGVEALWRERAVRPLPPEQELPFTLLAAERLAQRLPGSVLVRQLVEGGLPEELGGMARGSGLMRELLRDCGRLSQPDFDFLLERVLRLGQALGLSTEALSARANELGTGAIVLPTGLSGPTLLGGRWYLEPDADAEVVRGLAVDVPALLAEVSAQMRARNLLADGDVLHAPELPPAVALADWRPAVEIPRWQAAEAELSQRLGLKNLLVALCAVLAVAVGAVAVLAQQRKWRFVELKSDFVAHVSHELKTPLASIRLLAETLEQRLHGQPGVEDYPSRIVRSADGLSFLVENLLSFNRLDRGRWKPRLAPVRLEEVVARVRPELDELGVGPVQLRSELGDVEVQADPELMRLLLANLLRNGCLYNRSRPVALRLWAHRAADKADGSGRAGSGWTVFVQDNGLGIPESAWESVFLDFFRLERLDVPPGGEAVRGSGLGLALCRRILAAHRGWIRVEASGPGGTTVAFGLP